MRAGRAARSLPRLAIHSGPTRRGRQRHARVLRPARVGPRPRDRDQSRRPTTRHRRDASNRALYPARPLIAMIAICHDACARPSRRTEDSRIWLTTCALDCRSSLQPSLQPRCRLHDRGGPRGPAGDGGRRHRHRRAVLRPGAASSRGSQLHLQAEGSPRRLRRASARPRRSRRLSPARSASFATPGRRRDFAARCSRAGSCLLAG